ncbi:ACT domain-containing protein [Klebsiella pneumoniae]|nr:ACT domain-containing protein [Klebsiella pneumoniae]
MYDIHVILSNSPGSLGAMGMALGVMLPTY